MTESRQEWRRSWALPFVAAFGISGSNLLPYVSGLLLLPLTGMYGWTRSQFTLGLLLQIPIGIFAVPYFARFVDRYGPRRVLLTGIPVAGFGLALLGLIGQPIWQWWGLVALLGLLMAPVSGIGYMAAIITRFDASRGLALAIALAGVGLGATIWPVLGAFVLESWGWRAVFPVLGLGWALVLWPLAFATLPREYYTHSGTGDKAEKMPIGPALFSRTMLLLIAAGCLFILMIHGFNFNLVPILSGHGYSLSHAASIAGLAGLFAIAGRILTGYLLDRLPTRPLAIGVFLLPLITIALFLYAAANTWLTVIAVALLGFSLGSESDIISYIASRRLDRRVFASTYAIAISAFSVCAMLGPFLANHIFDVYHSYRPFFLAAGPVILLGTVLMVLVPNMNKSDTPI